MKGKPNKGVIPARRAVQIGFLFFVLIMGAQYVLWVSAHLDGHQPRVGRPAGVEGFLPISALMSLRLWLSGHGVHPVHPAALAILVGALIMGLVVAKSFCSHLCPVGTISEMLGRLGQRLLGGAWLMPRWLDIPLRGLKYVLLFFFVWATWVAMSVDSARAFLDSPYNRVADVKMFLFFLHPSRLTIAVLGVLTIGSVLVRDFWCRYLCPYGALLGFFGRLALFKVTRDEKTCIDCGKCTRVCPARLPVHAMKRTTSVECTSCQDCVAICPVEDCLKVRSAPLIPRRVRMQPTLVVVAVLATYFAIVTGFRLAGYWHSSLDEAEYSERIKAIDSPLYTHVGRLATSEDGQRPSVGQDHAPR